MELEGKIARKLNVQTGTSARGAWAKQEFVIEYQEGNYPSQVCMNGWGEDKVRELDKYKDIFTIISPLKTLHQSHPCPMLGRF